MLGPNTARGNVATGENGLAALPGREQDARSVIDQAIDYAVAIKTPNVHVMAGFADEPKARTTFATNLRYATDRARPHGITILIEPLNHYDAPNYFLQTSAQAKGLIDEIGADSLKLLFDCYHLQIMEGDVSRRVAALLPLIGHIQMASVPDRAEPSAAQASLIAGTSCGCLMKQATRPRSARSTSRAGRSMRASAGCEP